MKQTKQTVFLAIRVREETKKVLTRRKIAAEHKAKKEIGWDEFLLEATA